VGGLPEEGQDGWDSQIPLCGRNEKTGGTVRFLHVGTGVAFWLPRSLQKSRVMVGGFTPFPGVREQWPLLREEILLLMFSQKKTFCLLSHPLSLSKLK